MRRVPRLFWLFVLVAPAALAQQQGGEPQPAPSAPAPVMPSEAQGPQRPSISGPQMLAQGREYRKQIEEIRLQIQEQVQQAKNDKDVIRLNCLLDKLTQVNVNVNMMDQGLQALEQAVTKQDEGGELHDYARLTIVHQKVQVLKTEADACVGAETSYVGPTKVIVEKPQGLVDTVDQPPAAVPPFTVIDRLPPASAFQQ
jgi:hypothetical protein